MMYFPTASYSAVMKEELPKVLISMAIFSVSRSAAMSRSAPKSICICTVPILNVKGSAVIFQPSFTYASFTFS